ncbi:MAG TPA: hypothetical protein ENF94_01130 [Candidatus Woesearchaeota archaeon]|nr:MAG: hypothetical protein DRJ25_01230 [Candidatus Woesearchaeota archaeon]HDD70743.1 hypothetical protein [Candidatus Woesearchaeota archaeon]
MIIGLTGSYCSGKDTIANMLIERDFLHISLSDLLRNEMKKKNIKITRASLIRFANDLRKKFGPGVLARVAFNSMMPNTNYVISSIRNLFELEVLKSGKNFIHVHIEAPAKIRFERLLKRKDRPEDDKLKTFKDFVEYEKKEQGDDPLKQQLHIVSQNPDVIIRNDKSLDVLKKKVNKFLKKWMPVLARRPSWDEYFMSIAMTVGSRGTCARGKLGAVIVKDKRIVATGYAGSPVGLPHCDDVGHEFHLRTHEDGSVTKHCVRTTHGEANAIAQAARHGVSVKGGTIYCKMTPCYDCAKLIINAGIKRVVAERDYHASKESKRIFKQAGIKLDILINEVTKYANQK